MKTFGLVTADDPRALRIRVFVDGVDMTSLKPRAADDRHGWAVVLYRDAEGKAHKRPDGQGLIYEIRTGRVEIALDPERNR